MAVKVTLNSQDTIVASEAVVSLKIGKLNIPFIEATEVTAKVSANKEDVKRLGKRFTGKKTTSLEGTGSLKGYLVSSFMLTELLNKYKDGGAMPTMTMTTTVNDASSSAGSQTVTLLDMTFDDYTLFDIAADDKLAEFETDFTFEDYSLSTAFKGPKRS